MGQLTDTRPLATAALLAFILCAVSSCSAHEQLERKIASAAVWASNIDSRSLDISAPSILARAMSHAEVSSVKRTRDGFEILRCTSSRATAVEGYLQMYAFSRQAQLTVAFVGSEPVRHCEHGRVEDGTGQRERVDGVVGGCVLASLDPKIARAELLSLDCGS
eukprot:3934868-Rhodomonas_salina.2